MSEPAYLPSEISEHHQDGLLPGFGPEEATLEESLAPDSLVQPVLSLSIISTNEDGQLEVWDGIRYGRQWPEYADGTQPPQAWSEAETHPDTVSTATIRLGLDEARMLARVAGVSDMPWNIGRIAPFEQQLIAQPEPSLHYIPGSSALSTVSERLLDAKYDMHDLRQASTFRPAFSLSLAVIMGGYSAVGLGTEEIDGVELETEVMEPIIMFGAVAYMLHRRDIPKSTTGYWANTAVLLDDFETGIQEKDPAMLVADVNERGLITVCVKGLCVATTLRIIEDRKLLEAHLPIVAVV